MPAQQQSSLGDPGLVTISQPNLPHKVAVRTNCEAIRILLAQLALYGCARVKVALLQLFYRCAEL